MKCSNYFCLFYNQMEFYLVLKKQKEIAPLITSKRTEWLKLSLETRVFHVLGKKSRFVQRNNKRTRGVLCLYFSSELKIINNVSSLNKSSEDYLM